MSGGKTKKLTWILTNNLYIHYLLSNNFERSREFNLDRKEFDIIHNKIDDIKKDIDELKQSMNIKHQRTDENLKFIKESLFNPHEGL